MRGGGLIILSRVLGYAFVVVSIVCIVIRVLQGSMISIKTSGLYSNSMGIPAPCVFGPDGKGQGTQFLFHAKGYPCAVRVRGALSLGVLTDSPNPDHKPIKGDLSEPDTLNPSPQYASLVMDCYSSELPHHRPLQTNLEAPFKIWV